MTETLLSPVPPETVPAVPRVMGVLNLTPDSFHAPSRAASVDDALARALRMEEEGAAVIDLGGESTRPGAAPVDGEEELRRVLPVVEALVRRLRVPVSVDTSKAEVAARALDAGASILNDVTALRGDPAMGAVALRYPTVILMHMRGTDPRTMQEGPRYRDVVAEVAAFLAERLSAFEALGGSRERVWLDPGICFGKTLEHNLALFAGLETLSGLGRPLVVGASRKSFLGRLLPAGKPAGPEARLEGSLAAAARAAAAGVAFVRAHDVAETTRFLSAWAALFPRRDA